MDLSRAFDCFPYDLIIENLKRMGYLTVPAGLWLAMFQIEPNGLKLGGWLAQGSILGPLIFNIFINDIFYFITHSKILNMQMITQSRTGTRKSTS